MYYLRTIRLANGIWYDRDHKLIVLISELNSFRPAALRQKLRAVSLYPPMLTIYLVRHGQDLDNAHGILNGRRDQPLSEIGMAQAREVAAGIKKLGLSFDRVYCSPLQRARTTAKIITDTLEIPAPEPIDLLIERDFGIMTGQLQSDITKMCAPEILQTETVTYFLSPSGAETFPALIQRAKLLFDFLQRQHPDGRVLLVTHGDIGKMIYAAYYDLSWKEVLTMFHFGNSELLALSPDSAADETHVLKIEQHNL